MPTAPSLLRRAGILGAAITGLALSPASALADEAVVPCVPVADQAVLCPATIPAPILSPAPAPTPAPTAAAKPKPTAAKPRRGCRDGNLMPTTANVVRIRRATLCLLNRQRRRHHRRPLRTNLSLQSVAQRYSQEMVSDHFFDHVSPSGATFIQRIQQTRYLARAASWSLGENLAWGSGHYATPRETMDSWMHSPGHKHNILEPRYREIGIGVALGTPTDQPVPGATYTTEFGKRTSR